MKKREKEILLILLLVILFVASSFISKSYSDELQTLIAGNAITGKIVYILVMMTAVIVAPFETLPLLPLAASIWGPNIASILTIIGWTVGSLIAFGVARSFGRKFVAKITNIKDTEKWKNRLPKKNIFWLVAFARFVLPIDIISYAVGLFTKMHPLTYLAATLTGIIPFAYIFTFGSGLPVSWQIVVGVIALLIILFKYKAIKTKIRSVMKP